MADALEQRREARERGRSDNHNFHNSQNAGGASVASGANRAPLGLADLSDAELGLDGGGDGDEKEAEAKAPKELADFRPSGKLAAEAMAKDGVVLKHAEPASARMPDKEWRWYVFKDDEQVDVLPLHAKSSFLIGRDERVCEITPQHESISGQHAVLQHREVERKDSYDEQTGYPKREIVPSIIDLESTNGTYLNGNKIQSAIYIELKEQDVVRFGDSSREYVLLHAESGQ